MRDVEVLASRSKFLDRCVFTSASHSLCEFKSLPRGESAAGLHTELLEVDIFSPLLFSSIKKKMVLFSKTKVEKMT